MPRLAEKLKLSLVLTRTTTRFLTRISLSTLRLCKSLFSKTLAGLFSSMDNDYLFSSEDDDHLFDLDFQPNSSRQNSYYNQRTNNSRGFLDEDDREKVYLVPYRCVLFLVLNWFACLLFGCRGNEGKFVELGTF